MSNLSNCSTPIANRATSIQNGFFNYGYDLHLKMSEASPISVLQNICTTPEQNCPMSLYKSVHSTPLNQGISTPKAVGQTQYQGNKMCRKSLSYGSPVPRQILPMPSFSSPKSVDIPLPPFIREVSENSTETQCVIMVNEQELPYIIKHSVAYISCQKQDSAKIHVC